MTPEDLALLRSLLTRSRVLSLAVVLDDGPYASLLPFAMTEDYAAALVHASRLAAHSRGLGEGARFSAVVHEPDRADADPLQLARVTLLGTSHAVPSDDPGYERRRAAYLGKFPQSAMTFSLGDFTLYELRIEDGRLVGGFARATSFSAPTLARLTIT